jgi:hypothetical protein
MGAVFELKRDEGRKGEDMSPRKGRQPIAPVVESPRELKRLSWKVWCHRK